MQNRLDKAIIDLKKFINEPISVTVEDLAAKLDDLQKYYGVIDEQFEQVVKSIEDNRIMIGMYKGIEVKSISLDEYWKYKDVCDRDCYYYIIKDEALEQPYVVYRGKAMFVYDGLHEDFVPIQQRDIAELYPARAMAKNRENLKKAIAKRKEWKSIYDRAMG